MNKSHNARLTGNAQTLRRRMTKEERHLWYDFLKDLPTTINRQKIFGAYIVDFYCAQAKLVIELDGSQHYEDAGRQSDAQRDQYFRTLGITVLRYSNAQVNQNFDAVCAQLWQHIMARLPRKELT